MSYLLCTNRSLPCEGTGLELSEFPISGEIIGQNCYMTTPDCKGDWENESFLF